MPKTYTERCPHLERGLVIPVFQRPFTFEDVEGEAKLVRKFQDLYDGFELWEVSFPGEGNFPRIVHPTNIEHLKRKAS